MIWVVLILGAVVAIPLLIEYNRTPMDDIARGAAPGSFVELTHGTTHFEWFGPPRGPVAVCVHGLTTPSFVWRGLLRGLALMGFRILTYDLYGRGYSDRPSGIQYEDLFIDQLNDLLAEEGVGDDLTLIGYSMGGAIATAFAAAHPDRVRQLILLAPAGMGVVSGHFGNFVAKTPFVGDWLMLALFARHLRSGMKADADTPKTVEDFDELLEEQLGYKRYIPSVLAAMRGILAKPMKAEHQVLHQAGIPVLAIWGSDDPVIPIAAVGTLTEWSRNTRQEVIQGAGHGLPYTHSEQVLEILRENLRD